MLIGPNHYNTMTIFDMIEELKKLGEQHGYDTEVLTSGDEFGKLQIIPPFDGIRFEQYDDREYVLIDGFAPGED